MTTLPGPVKEHALTLGFSMVGVAPARPSPELNAYLRWVRAGMHGEMGYMAREDRVARRRDFDAVLPGARSLVVVGLDYLSLKLPATLADDPARGRIANYAWGIDYHDVMLARLKELAHFIKGEAGDPVATRAYVDTGAILERSHAKQAGLGFTGKNTMLIHPQRGSFFFLGEIITTAVLESDAVDLDSTPGCGTCTRCLTACPTNAFPRPYVLNARRCISYLTIELKGTIPADLRPLMGNWVFGCDVCQTVCPWQRFAEPTDEAAFYPDDLDRATPPLADLLGLTDAAFARRFAGTPIQRIGRARLVRNACVAAGNSGLAALAPHLTPLLCDGSLLVRGHAAWALGRLGAGQDALRAALDCETDEDVREEIRAALEFSA